MMRLRRINKVLLAFACGIAFCWACGTATAAVSSNPLKVVLVGDSYSAGNGAGDYYGPKGCYRSTSNWAEKYLDTLRAVRNVTFVNRACSGGVLNDVTQRRLQDDKTVTVFVPGTVDKDDASARQALDARGSCKTSYRDDEEYDIEAVSAAPSVPVAGTNVTFKCTRYMQPQANAIGRDTDLVLFTIGGNDVDFGQIVRQCFVVGVRDPSDCEDRVSAAQAEIGGVSARITGLLRNLKSRMRPDAKIALVAYPYLEKNPDFELRGEFLFLKTYAVGREVRRLGDMGDAGQRAAVNEVNGEAGPRVSFLDELKPHFAGHEPDGRACCRNDDRWVHEFDTFTPMEWYHFNGTGHSEVARLLSQRPDIGVGSAPVASGGSVDIAFVIDTTGSMGTAIDSVKAAATELVDTVAARTASARYALVDYRDFVERTGSPGDYPAKLQQDFTSSSATINAAIQGLALGDGGDSPETMYSGMNRAYELTWRPGVKKLVIVLADAPPLSPEPISGLTKEDMIQRALAIDPVEAQFVDISGHAGTADVSEIAARTNGAIHRSAPSEAAAEIAAVIETSLNQPYAWAGGPYVARAGDTVVLDGRGSYGVASDIVKWEWDIGADGNYEYTSDQPQTSHTYAAPFDGLIGLRVTDADGRTGLATVVGHASADGDEIADADDNCPAVDNRDQEDYDTDGIGDACDPTPGRPTTDIEGVTDNGRGTPAAPTPDPATPPDPARPPDPTPAPGSPQTVPGPAAKKKRADVRIGAPRLTANGKRVIVRLSCSRRSGACRGTSRGTLSGRSFKATYRIAARRGKIMRLKVPAGAQRSFARGSRLTLRLVTTAADGVKSSRTAKLRLRRSR